MNWLCFDILGTTFSGHPTATTMMNTWRTLCYMFYYLEEAGYSEPWRRDNILCLAAGDDSVANLSDGQVPTYVQSLEHLMKKDKSGTYGLGQASGGIITHENYDFDFCSKWVFSHGTAESIVIMRDYSKVLTQK